MPETTQGATIKKVFLRLMPVLFISYILAYIDRINIGFAAIRMNVDLGISPYIYGLGAGVFFLGYFIFEIPSNLMLEKTGARRLTTYQLLRHSRVAGRAAVFGAGWRCAA